MAEIENEKKIAANMAAIEEMQKAQEALMAKSIARLTGWKLIPVKKFIELMKVELAEEQKCDTS